LYPARLARSALAKLGPEIRGLRTSEPYSLKESGETPGQCRIDPDQSLGVHEDTYSVAAQEGCSMSKERANDLAQECSKLARKGRSFPTVWSTVLKGHALVEGNPRQRPEGKRGLLDIPLITGERLVFDASAKEFRVE
jgi:hypothetical protein